VLQGLKTVVQNQNWMITGPDCRRQMYHATARNRSIELQQINAETETTPLSHQNQNAQLLGPICSS